ncbi:hypothetical protein SKAU_G00428500 [Synaphobranchus kaupii]|uniref:Uncharacterized protein n=1 Tax=Synaphobranchus kaupii TaxID=118154 RepID=A0A9Q1E507_SYNKA|nr:hypothetical protein SKAU_G00428500 [Synaphobranchus kaupii]
MTPFLNQNRGGGLSASVSAVSQTRGGRFLIQFIMCPAPRTPPCTPPKPPDHQHQCVTLLVRHTPLLRRALPPFNISGSRNRPGHRASAPQTARFPPRSCQRSTAFFSTG